MVSTKFFIMLHKYILMVIIPLLPSSIWTTVSHSIGLCSFLLPYPAWPHILAYQSCLFVLPKSGSAKTIGKSVLCLSPAIKPAQWNQKGKVVPVVVWKFGGVFNVRTQSRLRYAEQVSAPRRGAGCMGHGCEDEPQATSCMASGS